MYAPTVIESLHKNLESSSGTYINILAHCQETEILTMK